jgi:serine/threonine protein kinase
MCIDNKTVTRHNTRTFDGSPGYMAPEVFRGIASIDADIYGLGTIILVGVTHKSAVSEDGDHISESLDPTHQDFVEVREILEFAIRCCAGKKVRPTARIARDTLNDLMQKRGMSTRANVAEVRLCQIQPFEHGTRRRTTEN